jgi:uncharacterized protein (TIGR03118 family)
MIAAHLRRIVLGSGAAAIALALPLASDVAQASGDSAYIQTNLVSNVPGLAQITDPNLVNAWGASYLPGNPGSPLWVSDNGTGLSTLYAGAVNGSTQGIVPLVVTIPGGDPTGQVSNTTTDFVVGTPGGTTAPAKFIFVGETGHISGWAPTVNGTIAQDAKVHPNAVYKGLAMGMTTSGPRLYAANFASGQVEMYNGAWGRVRIPGSFRDGMLPSGYAPFNVAVVGDRVYVAFAKQDAMKHDEIDGAGLGRVDVFNLQGTLLHRAGATGVLDAPWGLTIAPAGFGSFAGDLLVGNFGDGRIHVFTPTSLTLVGTVRDTAGHAIAIDGLWALLPGDGTEASASQVLFTAGPDGESNGLLGVLSAAPAAS